MSAEHKAALAQGRSEGKAVRDYLDALRANKPKRGRKRTADSIKKRLAAIDSAMPWHLLRFTPTFRMARHSPTFPDRLAEAVGLARPGLEDAHVELLAALGLPVGGVRLDPDQVLAAMATDKKQRKGLRLVLLRDLGQPEVVTSPDRQVLVAAIRSLAEDPR